MMRMLRPLLASALLLVLASSLSQPIGGAHSQPPLRVAPNTEEEIPPVIEHPDTGREMIASSARSGQSA